MRQVGNPKWLLSRLLKPYIDESLLVVNSLAINKGTIRAKVGDIPNVMVGY